MLGIPIENFKGLMSIYNKTQEFNKTFLLLFYYL